MNQVTPIAFICIVIGLMAWSIQDWVGPERPVFIMLGIAVAIFAVRYTYQIFTGEEVTLKDSIPQPVEIAAAVIAIALSALWLVPSARSTAVSFAALTSQINVEKALGDESPDVQIRACEQLFEMEIGKSVNRLINHLGHHPPVARGCFKSLNDRGKKTTSTAFIATKLAKSWNNKLMTDPLPHRTDMLAQYVEAFYDISTTHTPMPGRVHVLACATASINLNTRKACASFLSSKGNLATSMGRVEDFPVELSKAVYPTLAALTFQYKQLDEDNQGVANQLATQSAPTQRWVAELGCFLIKGQDEAVDGVRGLVSFVEGGPCRPDDDKARMLFSSVETWGYVCEVSETFPRETPIQKSLCEGMNRSLVAMAVEEAKRWMIATVRSYHLMAISVASPETNSMYNNKATFAARLKAWDAISRGDSNFSSMSANELRLAFGMTASSDKPMMEALGMIPGLDKVFAQSSGLKSALDKNLNFDMNTDHGRNAAMAKAMSVLASISQGKAPIEQAVGFEKAREMRSNKKGMASAAENMREPLSHLKSSGSRLNASSSGAGSSKSSAARSKIAPKSPSN